MTFAEKITKESSFQTFITIKLLVDRSLVEDCFKAYAYFRWIDDEVDLRQSSRKKRVDYIKRQKKIIQKSYLNKPPVELLPEEKMIVDLISTNRNKNSKLGSFILNFFRIIEYDAYRKNGKIQKRQLEWYCKLLSKAVTDGVEYFINNSFSYPQSDEHYRAGMGACITHMLRDYRDDVPNGFINIPKEYLLKHRIKPHEINSEAFKTWVKAQVLTARGHFTVGKQYISKLPVVRGKIAALWYCARFECVLDEIEKDGFQLRTNYKRGKISNYLRMIAIALQTISFHRTYFRKETLIYEQNPRMNRN